MSLLTVLISAYTHCYGLKSYEKGKEVSCPYACLEGIWGSWGL